MVSCSCYHVCIVCVRIVTKGPRTARGEAFNILCCLRCSVTAEDVGAFAEVRKTNRSSTAKGSSNGTGGTGTLNQMKRLGKFLYIL